ncbi:MAG: hypothetical protein LH477_07900 [Nocardioides sp.]|nr:hypothetical protein [Nocardioides sp.]
MTPVRRWCVVALVAVLLAATPVALRWLPAGSADVSSATLLQQARTAVDGSWSGTVEIDGSLQLPDADQFSGLAALFGERTRLRVWWQDTEHWRVDRLLTTGETDLVRNGTTTLEWDFERSESTISREPEIRLPRAADLLPPALAERLLRGVKEADVTALPARRVAGRSASGLRVQPPSPLSSIDRVDLWTDGDSGVPLLVEVYAAGSSSPDFTSRFTDYSPEPPAPDTLTFVTPATAEVTYDDVLDIADAANQYAPLRPPTAVAGLGQTDASDGAVGVYGEGTAQVIAIPLRDREADAFRDQMALTTGVEQDQRRTVVTLGPLGILLTGTDGEGGWLLAGTLTRDALEQAGRDVVSGFVFVDEAG